MQRRKVGITLQTHGERFPYAAKVEVELDPRNNGVMFTPLSDNSRELLEQAANANVAIGTCFIGIYTDIGNSPVRLINWYAITQYSSHFCGRLLAISEY